MVIFCAIIIDLRLHKISPLYLCYVHLLCRIVETNHTGDRVVHVNDADMASNDHSYCNEHDELDHKFI